MKRNNFLEKIGDNIIENLTDSLFQDFEVQVGEKKLNIFIDIVKDQVA